MTGLEWLNGKKELCERGVEFYQNKVSAFEKDLEVIRELIVLEERKPAEGMEG